MTLYEAMQNSQQGKIDAIYEKTKDTKMQHNQTDTIKPKRSGAGRPVTIESAKRTNVYLDENSVKQALVLGNGNVSHGIRIALYRSTEVTTNQGE